MSRAVMPGAQLVEIDSDHYLTLREPEHVTQLLEEFLSRFVTCQFLRSITRQSAPPGVRTCSLLPFSTERCR